MVLRVRACQGDEDCHWDDNDWSGERYSTVVHVSRACAVECERRGVGSHRPLLLHRATLTCFRRRRRRGLP